MTDEEKDFIVENAYMAGLPISERTEGIAFDNEQSNPFERLKTPTPHLPSIDDPHELRGGREMARRIPNSQFIGLTGGHFLFGHAIGDSGRNRRVHRTAFE